MNVVVKAVATALVTAVLLAAPARADTVSGIADLMASIQSSRAMAGEIEALGAVTHMEVIHIDTIVGPEEAAALNATLHVDAPAVKDIHDAIAANDAVAAHLAAEDVEVQSVIAVNAHASGRLRLYVR